MDTPAENQQPGWYADSNPDDRHRNIGSQAVEVSGLVIHYCKPQAMMRFGSRIISPIGLSAGFSPGMLKEVAEVL